jgi:hypothetical protein
LGQTHHGKVTSNPPVFKKSVGLTLFLILNSFKFRPQLIHFPLQGYMGSILPSFFPMLTSAVSKVSFGSKIAIGLCEFPSHSIAAIVALIIAVFHHHILVALAYKERLLNFQSETTCWVSKTSHPLILLNTELILSNIWLSCTAFERI